MFTRFSRWTSAQRALSVRSVLCIGSPFTHRGLPICRPDIYVGYVAFKRTESCVGLCILGLSVVLLLLLCVLVRLLSFNPFELKLALNDCKSEIIY